MFKIDANSNISFNRGDTAPLNIVIYVGGKQKYKMEVGDKVYLSVKESLDPGYPLVLQKVATIDDVVGDAILIKIVPADTDKLELGAYVYDVELNTRSGDIYTVIGPSSLTLLPSVTNYGETR